MLANAPAAGPSAGKPMPPTNPGMPALDFPEVLPPQWAGQKIVKVAGTFPGKDGECVLMLQMKADQLNKEAILAMLKSIH
jgi:hypothetical protein